MSGQGIAQFIPLILIFVIFYFFLIRPQQKRVKDHKAMVESLKRGDEIIIPDKNTKIEVGDNVIFITMSKDVSKAEEIFKIREAY